MKLLIVQFSPPVTSTLLRANIKYSLRHDPHPYKASRILNFMFT